MSFNPNTDVYSSHEVEVIGLFQGDDESGVIHANGLQFTFSLNHSGAAGVIKEGDVAVVRGCIFRVSTTHGIELFRCKVKPVVYQREGS